MKKTRFVFRVEDPFFLIFALLAACLGILMPLLSPSYGITWDEWLDNNYGMRILKYILSGGENTSYTDFGHGYLYSGFFFTLAGLLQGIFSGSLSHFVYDVFEQTDSFFRFFQFNHLLNSLFGFYFFFFTGLCAKEVKNWRTACVALLLMAASPRIFGHAMNNPKDIPLAATYAAALYGMILVFKQMPRPSFKSTLFLTLCIGFSIGCRVGAVILIGYLFLFGFFFYAYTRWIEKKRAPWLPWFGRLAVMALYGYAIGLFFWPYGQLNPFLNSFHALAKLSDFRFHAGSIFFQGAFRPTTHLPWNYLPVWITITTPLAVLAGWLLFSSMYPLDRRNSTGRFVFFLAFAGIFPILFVILKRSVVYNDWRHLYFTYGPLVVLAALGWDTLWQRAKSKKLRAGVALFFFILISLPLSWMIRNHPYQALYFNEFEGGLKGAVGRYEIDYWGVTLRKAAEWLADYHLRHWPNQPAYVKANGFPMSTYAILRERLGSRYFPFYYPDRYIQSRPFRFLHIFYEKTVAPPEWDYEISLLQPQTLQDLQKRKWPPPNTLYTVEVDGVPVCVVTQNPLSGLFNTPPANTGASQ